MLRRLLAGAILSVLALGAAAPAAPAQDDAAAQQLADRYAPIVMVRKQDNPPCDIDREQYQLTSVDAVLGNPDATLRRTKANGKLEAVKTAPTVEDIADKGEGWYIDLHGHPRGDTCVYARDFARLVADGKAPVVTYAHVVREDGQPGIALQYWFFWYFNQFNDLHEGDWEGMQIVWDDASTPAEALQQEPSQMILFQHAGGERAEWNAAKVEKEGDHPIVYAAAGSHATFYSSAVFVENGGHGSGLGCDNTSVPLRELRPKPILLPTTAPQTGPFAWLNYTGRWGQRESGYNNGPTGPATKTQWTQPITWMDAQRTTSARLPGGALVGPQVTSAFCSTVSFVTGVMNLPTGWRWVAYGVLALLAGLLALLVGWTRWGPVDLDHLRARRAFGQVLRTAGRLYRGHWALVLSCTILPIALIGLVQWAYESFLGGGRVGNAIGDLIETLSRPAAIAVINGVVIATVLTLVRDGRAEVGTSWRLMASRFWRLFVAHLLYQLVTAAMAITVILLPWAVWKLVGWAFVQQEILFEDRPIRGAFRASSQTVRGRWWHAARPLLFFYLLGVVLGPVFSFALIFTALPLIWIDVFGAAIFALLLPYTALGTTLVYFDLQERAAAEGVRPRRSWRFWRRSRAVTPPASAPAGSPS
jgi:hypothetical protein